MGDVERHLEPHGRPDAIVARLAATRHGVISRRDAIRAGLTPRMIRIRVETGRWQRLHPEVYRLTGTAPSWRQALIAACLALGNAAVASHAAAGALVQLAGLTIGAIEVTVLRGARRRRSGVTVHETSELPAVDVTVVDNIPATTTTRTLLDLAGVCSEQVVEEALDDALRRNLTSIPRLKWRLEDLGCRPGVAVMKRLLDARTAQPIPKSVFETRLLRVIVEASLPPPVRQHQVRDRGRLVAVVDFAYPDARLAIEADSYRWHSSRARWQHDLARSNELTRLGWRVIHVTWSDLERRPAEIHSLVVKALGER